MEKVLERAEAVKARMRAFGINQCDMVNYLRVKGETIDDSLFSKILRGVATQPKSMHVLQLCDEIIDERLDLMLVEIEKEKGGRDGR